MQDPQEHAPSRARLIDEFTCVAHQLVRRYRHWSLDQEDVFQSAMLAVIEAVDSYDPARGIPLGAYVAYRIRCRLCNEIASAQLQTRPDARQVPDDPDEDLDAASDLWDAIEQLPARDQAILIRFHGLDGKAPASRDQLGRKHRRSVTTITKSTTRSIKTLRAALSA